MTIGVSAGTRAWASTGTSPSRRYRRPSFASTLIVFASGTRQAWRVKPRRAVGVGSKRNPSAAKRPAAAMKKRARWDGRGSARDRTRRTKASSPPDARPSSRNSPSRARSSRSMGRSQSLLETLTQDIPGALQPFADDQFADLKPRGDFPAGKMIRVEAVEGVGDVAPQFLATAAQRLEGVAPPLLRRAVPFAVPRVEVFQLGVRQPLHPVRTRPFQVFHADDAPDPGGEVAPSVKPGEVAVNGQESLLDDILGNVRPPGQGQRIGQQPSMVLPYQRLELLGFERLMQSSGFHSDHALQELAGRSQR